MKKGKEPLYGVYRARVLSTRDPTSRGRIHVQLPAVTGTESSRWALLASTAPREGDTVVVAFEAGDVNAPIVVGVLWSGGDRPPDSRSS